jgi:hypothetical protein
MFSRHPLIASIVGLVLPAALIGCGGKTATICTVNSINVSPATATVNHLAAPPGNTQQFDAFQTSAPSGCAFQLSNLKTATWAVSDPVNVSISNVQDNTYGVATCKNATAGAVTVTATVPKGDGTNVTNTASLTCN